MDIEDIEIDPAILEGGAWVGSIPDMPGLLLKVRGIGNHDYLKHAAELRGERPSPSDDAILSACLHRTVLLDWEGIEGDDGGQIPFSSDMAEKYLTDPAYARFREAVLWAADRVALKPRDGRDILHVGR